MINRLDLEVFRVNLFAILQSHTSVILDSRFFSNCFKVGALIRRHESFANSLGLLFKQLGKSLM